MKSLSLLVAFNALSIVMSASPFVGDWKLVGAQGEDNADVALPEGDYKLHIEDIDAEHLKLNIKIGNMLSTKITLEGTDSETTKKIRVGGVRSTMMMPPEAQFKLETYLSRILPKMDVLSVVDGTLTFEGEGKIVCEL